MKNKVKLSLGELPNVTREEIKLIDNLSGKALEKAISTVQDFKQRKLYNAKLNSIAERFLHDCQANGLYRHELEAVIEHVRFILGNQLIVIDFE